TKGSPMNKQLATRVIAWHTDNGGFCSTYSDYQTHALRLLHEATGLCLACGATQEQIFEVGSDEINKHAERYASGEIVFEGIGEEIADVAILLEVLAYYTNNPIDLHVDTKLDVLHNRLWTADAHGVLWRRKDGDEEAAQ
ncbi:hypothetical protein LCGC14_2623140, partial [marine sediment metagenome]